MKPKDADKSNSGSAVTFSLLTFSNISLWNLSKALYIENCKNNRQVTTASVDIGW